jgi:hypothetical protein
MFKMWQALVELKLGENDELFESSSSIGGYIMLYAQAEDEGKFRSKIRNAIESYGSFLVEMKDIEESKYCVDDLPEWMDVFFGNLNTF